MKIRLLLFLLLQLVCAFATQAQAEVEMADTMRSQGKIYVVVGILLTILLGLFGYLLLVDRKVTRLEKRLDQK